MLEISGETVSKNVLEQEVKSNGYDMSGFLTIKNYNYRWSTE